MILVHSATLIAALIAPAQGGPDDPRARQIAPFVGDEVALLAHVDLTDLEINALARGVLTGALAGRAIDEATEGVDGWLASLRGAGAEAFYLLVDPADQPGPPVAVVPLAEGADAEAIGRILCGAEGPSPVYDWPTCATVRGAVFAGTDAALERIRRLEPASRPDLAAAFAASGDGPARILLAPSADQRRVFEEFVPTLPESLGGVPITALTRGLDWVAITLEAEPTARLRVIVQAQDDGAARSLDRIAGDALALLGDVFRADPSFREMVGDLNRITREVADDRLELAVDLEQATALVSVPLLRAREAARRTECVNNMKTLGLAMHNYHSRHKSFPPAYSAAEDGSPLLSWRVHILPFLDQQTLYDEFRLDEPWDSPHNRTLINRMPQVYRCPSADATEPGTTSYLVPRGDATIFSGAGGMSYREITDGTSNTILVVDAAAENAVIWTKPEDWEVGDAIDPGMLIGNHPGGFNATFADGSVRFLRESIDPDVLRKLTTPTGGEVIGRDDL